jgi:hypothetical protein
MKKLKNKVPGLKTLSIIGGGVARYSSLQQENIEANVLMFSHILEKGMGRKNLRLEFGNESGVLSNLIANLAVNSQTDSATQKIGLSALDQYIKLHEESGSSTKFVLEKLDDNLINQLKNLSAENSQLSGIKSIQAKDNKEKSFAEIVSNRYSVRMFADKLVDETHLNEAFELGLFVN